MALFHQKKKAAAPEPKAAVRGETGGPKSPSHAHLIPHHVRVGVLKRPHESEKAHTLTALRNQYVFVIHGDANKRLVRDAIEHSYRVQVERVRIVREPGKTKRWRNMVGRQSGIKKAIVTVAKGQKIEIV